MHSTTSYTSGISKHSQNFAGNLTKKAGLKTGAGEQRGCGSNRPPEKRLVPLGTSRGGEMDCGEDFFIDERSCPEDGYAGLHGSMVAFTGLSSGIYVEGQAPIYPNSASISSGGLLVLPRYVPMPTDDRPEYPINIFRILFLVTTLSENPATTGVN
ncbi:hypothetical protein BGZ63DRAFT_400454 [Mariannaea sp. PMI_226]|nr:hypothetical protein BGZ63DRAFT_400454 [Mariannaea sp. PMI_226]